MYGIHCEVESCFHNVNKMCFCPVPVHLTETKLMGAVMLNCSEYQDRNMLITETAEAKKVPAAAK